MKRKTSMTSKTLKKKILEKEFLAVILVFRLTIRVRREIFFRPKYCQNSKWQLEMDHPVDWNVGYT